MKKQNLILLLITQTLLASCIVGPDSQIYQREMQHMNEYLNKDQTERNKFHQKQAVNDLRECKILIKMGKWEYSESKIISKKDKMVWKRDQSWMYLDGMISEEDTGIDNEDYVYPENTIFLYVGPWKDITLEYGTLWSKTKINKKIRFTAIQKKDDKNKGYIYASYEFMTPKNQHIKEKPLTIPAYPVPVAERLCEVKWVAKHGYNAIFDVKSERVIDAKE